MSGTFAAVIRSFLNSPAFLSKAAATQNNWRKVLKLAEVEGGLGGCSVQVIRPAIIQGFLDGLADRTGVQSIARTALKAVEKHALVRDLVPYPFMIGTTVTGSDTGHEPWTFEQVEIAVKYARPFLVRAVQLALHTGQRGSDLVRMCPTDIEEKVDPITGVRRRGINVAQQKTDLKLWVPFFAEFEAILATWERTPGPFIRHENGKPMSRSKLSCAWNHERDTNPDLIELSKAGLVLHGLRATAVVWRRKKGLTSLQIASIIGMSEPMVSRYCRLADQGTMAMAAIHFLDGTPGERQLSTFRKVDG
jgi:integrase